MSIEPTPSAAEPQVKRSAVELIKENSRQLRGTIALELVQGTDHFNEQDKQLIKFHGFYQQDDRDARKDRHREGAGKAYNFMVRCKIPGGRASADQYLVMDDLASKYGSGTLRITTRQGFQLHGVLKKNLKETIASINRCLLTTLGACGDVERNVMAPPAPLANPVYRQLQETAVLISQHLAPRSRAYHELWLNGEAVYPPTPTLPRQGGGPSDFPSPLAGEGEGGGETEPIYGKVYLPRKFKTGLAIPEDNSVDIYAHDLGLLAIVEEGQIVGYNALVGGGMGMTHGNANTFPYIARPICYIQADQLIPAIEGIIKLFRDHGNRADRKRARLKYVVHDWGVEKFREVLATYLPFPLVLPRAVEVKDYPLFLGWNPQGDGKYFYGISVASGRIKDEGDFRLRTCLRTLVQKYRPEIRLTPSQDIFLCGLEKNAKADIERTLTEHGVLVPAKISNVRKYSIACPAIPTCGLAISEAERVLPDLISQFETALGKLGLKKEKINIRMTGCPNGCARPYQSEIGIVGRSGDKYCIFIGGSLLGQRLNFVLKDLVPLGQIVPLLVPILKDFKKNRQPGESFGDYCHRLGQEKLQAMAGDITTSSPSTHAAG